MAAARAPRVYAADIDGVHEWIVAAPNQRAALDALGVNQDLFAQGLARPEKDPVKVEAARDQPGVALRRPKGSKGDFEPAGGDGSGAWDAALKAAPKGRAKRSAQEAPKPSKAARPASAQKAAPPRRETKPPPDRRPVLEARKALKAFGREAARTLGDLGQERAEVERRIKRAESSLAKRRESLTRAVEKAQAAYDRARADA